MSKFSPEDKMKAVEWYLTGTFSVRQISINLECSESIIKKWIDFFRQYGPDSFLRPKQNNAYTAEFKEKVVTEY